MVRNGFYAELLEKGDMEAYENSFGEHIGTEIGVREQDVYYALYDIDGNGIIEVFYTNSAAESGIDFYKIGADGVVPEPLDSFTMVGSLVKEEVVFTYYQNSTEISEEEYNAKIKDYEAVEAEGLEWIQIQ